MALAARLRTFTVADYYKMAEAGILGEDDRVELLEGEITQMTPIGDFHAACVKRSNHVLGERARGRAIVSIQDPVRLSDDTEPQPDIVLLKLRDDFYASGHPGPGDVLLLIEVADTSLAYDRGVKLPLYAKAGIVEVWIADIVGERVLAFREPDGGTYRVQETFGRGETLRVSSLAGVELQVEEILP